MATGTDSVREHVSGGIVFKTRLAKRRMRGRSFSAPAASGTDPPTDSLFSACYLQIAARTGGPILGTHGCGVLQQLSWRGGVHVLTVHSVPWPPGCDRVIMSSSRGRHLQEIQLLPSSWKVPASTYGAPPDDTVTAPGTRGARMTASAGARAAGVRPSSALRRQARSRMTAAAGGSQGRNAQLSPE